MACWGEKAKSEETARSVEAVGVVRKEENGRTVDRETSLSRPSLDLSL